MTPGHSADDERYRTSLDGLLDPFVVLTAERDASGRIVDFRYTYANPAACAYNHIEHDELLGRRLLEVLPEHESSGLFAQYCQIVETGEPLVAEGLTYHDTWGGRTDTRQFDVRAYRVGDSLAYTWRDVTERERMTRELQEAERLARLGRWYWDPASDQARWSRQLAEIMGTPRNTAAENQRVSLSELAARMAHPDDVDALLAACRETARAGTPFLVEHRLVRSDGELRNLVTRGEAVRDDTGRMISVRGTSQDVTDQYQTEQRLLRARRRLLEQRFALEREHTVSQTLQQAIMPGGGWDVPGLQLAARYQPADSTTRIGGDWYDVVQLETGEVALVVGDVEGHDVAAASLMGQLRSAVRTGLLAGRSPAQTLADTDRFLHSLGAQRMATAVVLILAADRRSATLCLAGHPPVLCADPSGGVAFLDAEPCPPLGVWPQLPRTEHTAPLQPGEVLALYSDGLVEHRSHTLEAGITALRDRLGTLLSDAHGHRPDAASPDAGNLAEHLVTHLLDLAPGDASDDLALLVAIIAG